MKTTRTKVGLGGFTLVEIMIVIAIIGLLCAIAIPNYVRARANSQANACINNLHQIADAVDEFALEKGKTTGYAINYPNDITPYIRLNSNQSIPSCPAGGSYTVKSVGSVPQVACSLENITTPAHMLQ